jgi:hypothetical protein
LEDHTREATHVVPMGNYVIAGVGNYVIVNPSNLGNYVIADTRDVIKAKCTPYLRRGQPAPRTHLVKDDDHTIIKYLRSRVSGPGQLLPAGR